MRVEVVFQSCILYAYINDRLEMLVVVVVVVVGWMRHGFFTRWAFLKSWAIHRSRFDFMLLIGEGRCFIAIIVSREAQNRMSARDCAKV